MNGQSKEATDAVDIEQFRTLLDYSEDAVFITDRETLEVVGVNARACRYVGSKREQILGTPLQDFVTSHAWKKVLKWLPPATSAPTERLVVSSVLQGKKQRKTPTEVAFSVDQTGKEDYIVAVARNVTVRRRAEERRQRSGRIIRLLTQGLISYIWGRDRDLRFTYVSTSVEIVLGYSLEEVMKLDFEDLFTPDSLEVARDAFAKLAESRKEGEDGSEKLRTVELEMIRKDGSSIWVETTMLASESKQGRTSGYVGVSRDITARVRSEEKRRELEIQVQQTQKLESLGVLAGGIAHDFNNLLTGIQGYASLALLRLDKDSQAREYLRALGEAATRATELTNQLLAYSGKGRFVVEPLNLSEIVEGLTQLLSVSVSKKAELRCDCDKNLPQIEGDSAQIQQVVMNLITNASDAIGDDPGVISVSTGALNVDAEYLSNAYLDIELPEGQYAYIEVSDTGCGMDSETLSKIFDPFFTTKFTGRGLGLAAVLGIVRSHRGTIKIDSEVGKGTTTRVLFPCTGPPESFDVGYAKADSALDDIDFANTTILVVDDEEIVRSVARMMLEEAGFTVVIATDGYEALHLFRERAEDFAAVLLDLTMPRMDGEETFVELRQIRADIPVILSSGYSEEDVADRFRGKNPAGFVQKPYRTTMLINELKRVLGIEEDAL